LKHPVSLMSDSAIYCPEYTKKPTKQIIGHFDKDKNHPPHKKKPTLKIFLHFFTSVLLVTVLSYHRVPQVRQRCPLYKFSQSLSI